MTKAERMILEDAIRSAVEAEKGRLKFKRALFILGALNLALLGLLGGLLVWIVAY